MFKPRLLCDSILVDVHSLKLTWHLKIGRNPKGNSSSNHPFAGVFAVSFREGKFRHSFWITFEVGNFVEKAEGYVCWTEEVEGYTGNMPNKKATQ